MLLAEIQQEGTDSAETVEELLFNDETPQSTEDAESRKLLEELTTASYTPTPIPLFSYKGNDITSIFIIFALVMFGIITYLIYLLKEKHEKRA